MQHLLLLHGAIGAKDQLEALKEKLQDHFIIHTLNFSGHGGEGFTEPFSIELFAKEVLQYLDENKIESISIFGYSMGGYVAIYLAKHYPAKINKVVTLATMFYWDIATAAKEGTMLNAEKIEEKVPAFAQVLAKRHAPNDWKVVLQKTKDMLMEMGKKNPLVLKDYADIQQPVLILLGDSDKMVPWGQTTEVFNQLPNGKLVALPETEHPIEKVDMGELSRILVDWLIR